MRRWKQALAALLLASLSGRADEFGGNDLESLKYQYLAKFPKFIEWPATLPAGTFTLCVLGDESLAAIAKAIGDQHAQQRSFTVVDGKRVGNLGNCHILFVGRSEEWRAGNVVAMVRSAPVLTISDVDGFAARGGVIEFVERDLHLKFEINLSAANNAGLRISAKLAELAVKTY